MRGRNARRKNAFAPRCIPKHPTRPMSLGELIYQFGVPSVIQMRLLTLTHTYPPPQTCRKMSPRTRTLCSLRRTANASNSEWHILRFTGNWRYPPLKRCRAPICGIVRTDGTRILTPARYMEMPRTSCNVSSCIRYTCMRVHTKGNDAFVYTRELSKHTRYLEANRVIVYLATLCHSRICNALHKLNRTL